jgi:hypothetical protein
MSTPINPPIASFQWGLQLARNRKVTLRSRIGNDKSANEMVRRCKPSAEVEDSISGFRGGSSTCRFVR